MGFLERISCVAALAALAGCAAEAPSCGPTRAVVGRVIDGDTLELTTGTKVRYLMVDTPESTQGHDECFGAEARELNRRLVEGREVSLRYDEQCTDRYGRLLAYVSVEGREVNTLLVEQGYACVLHIPPNGADRAAEFEAIERRAARDGRGLWGRCDTPPCR